MIDDLINDIDNILEKVKYNFIISGFITSEGKIYPLGADTKVLSSAFELVIRPYIYQIAEKYKLDVTEPESQNFYPDFTLHDINDKNSKIAIDIKTTYRKSNNKFGFTLGGYTSFMRDGNETKNIVYPYPEYTNHLVIGFVYDRVSSKKSSHHKIYNHDEFSSVKTPYNNVESFVNHKWKISSDRAGSSNTTNIGSIFGTIQDFKRGKGVFATEEEFNQYWKNYGRTSKDRNNSFSNIEQFRLRLNT